MRNNTQSNYSNINNLNINNILRYVYLLSFFFQWSILSMILNLLTIGLIRIPLFIIFIIDALSMLVIKNKTIIKPSFILSHLWSIISYLFKTDMANTNNPLDILYKFNNIIGKINSKFDNLKNKCSNIYESILDIKRKNRQYKKTRQLYKLNEEIGKYVIVQSISYGKLSKKKFKHTDRTQSYINMLESNGYKDFTKYNINPNDGKCYVILNKNNDIIDIQNNKIQVKHDHPDYKFIMNGWNN